MRAAALLLAGLSVAACTGPPTASPAIPVLTPPDPVAAESVVVPSSPVAPTFAFPTLADSSIVFTAEAFAGRFVVIDFWATWCTPCLEEIPNLTAVRADYADRGLDVLSVSLDFFQSDIAAFRQRVAPMDWHHAFVGERFSHPSVQAFGVDRLPHAVLIGPDGTIRARAGHLRRDLLRITIDREITAHEATHAPPP